MQQTDVQEKVPATVRSTNSTASNKVSFDCTAYENMPIIYRHI